MKVLLMCICLSVVTANEQRCDGQGYFYSKYLDRCYKLHNEKADWFGAVRLCRSEGATLLVLETIKEANYIKSLGVIENYYGNGYGYVGVHDMLQEGVFITIHGDLLDTLEFRTFHEGEPNNVYHTFAENCLFIWNHFTYGDIFCRIELAFYCEKAAKKQDDKHRSLTLQVPKEGFCSPIVVIP